MHVFRNPRVGEYTDRAVARDLIDPDMIQQKQCLRCDDRLITAFNDPSAIRPVEQRVEAGCLAAGPDGHQIQRVPRDGNLRETWATWRWIQQPRNRQQ